MRKNLDVETEEIGERVQEFKLVSSFFSDLVNEDAELMKAKCFTTRPWYSIQNLYVSVEDGTVDHGWWLGKRSIECLQAVDEVVMKKGDPKLEYC